MTRIDGPGRHGPAPADPSPRPATPPPARGLPLAAPAPSAATPPLNPGAELVARIQAAGAEAAAPPAVLQRVVAEELRDAFGPGIGARVAQDVAAQIAADPYLRAVFQRLLARATSRGEPR